MKWNPQATIKGRDILTARITRSANWRERIRAMLGEMIRRDAPKAIINPEK